MQKPSIFKLSALRRIFLGKNNRNLFLFSAILIANAMAASLEGTSFALILLSLNTLSNVQLDATGAPFSMLVAFFPANSPQKVFVLCIGLAVLAQVCRSFFTYIGQTAALFLGIRMQVAAQKRVYEQIFRFSFPCVNRYKSGELLEYAKIPSLLITALMLPISQLAVSLFTIIASVLMMFFISPVLTLLAAAAFGFLVFSQKFIIRKISSGSQTLANHMMDFSKYTVQSLQAIRLIHTFQRQKYVLSKIQLTLDQVVATTKKLRMWSQSIVPLNEMLGISIVGIFLVVGETVIGANVIATLPMLLTFVIIMHRLNVRIQALLESIGGIACHVGEMRQLEEILDDAGKEFLQENRSCKTSFSEKILFEDVSLKHPSAKHPSVQGLSLEIPKGSITAFVGTSGAGKSSLIDLLLGLYDPTEGEILIDGTNLKEIDLTSWRDRLGVVSQDTFIFNGTVRENILFGKLDASQEEIERVCTLSGAHSFISHLPEAYDTVVGERGHRLSGGERQRLAMARALIRDPEVLILDEATSNLDSHSEQLIQKALDQLSRDKTIILVAHRLSTICHADQIAVLERGRLVEIGTHLELIAQKGSYQKFWSIQSKGLKLKEREKLSLSIAAKK